ncbi:MAG: flagellar biosynthetic protein FliQ [Pirellulales bacterium]
MTGPQVVDIGRELLMTVMLCAMPAVVCSLVVGLAVSLLQTVTSIQEQTLSFVPRIVAVGVVIVFTLPWSLQLVVNFTYRMFWQLAEAGR